MNDARTIRDLIEPIAAALGFEIVRLSFGGSGRPVLQIMAECPDGTMSVGQCARLSREISAFLEVEDPISGEYILEVSSPGIDRPLTRLKDFDRYKGFVAKIELSEPQDGQRRFRGPLKGIAGDDVTLNVDGRDVSVPFAGIIKAKLVLTDDLIDASKGIHGKDFDEGPAPGSEYEE